MTTDEAKEILLSTRLSPLVREAVNVLVPDLLDYYNLQGEEWRDVIDKDIDYDCKYQVSSLGRVRSFKAGKVKILKPIFDDKGYSYVGIHKNGKQRKVHVHALAAKAFIPNPESKPFVNHINGIKSDNRVENLEWVTPSENIQHAIKTGLIKTGCDRPDSKLERWQVIEIRRNCVPNSHKLGFSAFAKKFNVDDGIVRLAYYRETYKNVE